jgi:hypothetical protein
VLALAAGAALLHRHWGLGHARWLAVKIGLTLFLLVPRSDARWIATSGSRGLRRTSAPPLSKDLVRGIGMDDMLRALAAPLLPISVPLLAWLSLRKPGSGSSHDAPRHLHEHEERITAPTVTVSPCTPRRRRRS